jgi:putative membrane protein
MGAGVRTLSGKLPEDARLDAFAAGGQSLAAGAGKMLGGIELLQSSLPKAIGKLDGSAKGLADSVEPELEVLAPVSNNGSAFAPNMVSVALWIGAVMTAYLFNMRMLHVKHADAGRIAKSLGKFSAPALVAMFQVLVMFLMVVFGLEVRVTHPFYFVVTLMTASLVFLAMIFAMLRIFGEAGKLLAVLLLTLQLAAGGGVMPIELSGDFFRAVHGWLPFTWVVKAFRVSLFDALQGQWLYPWAVAMAGGVFALVVATLVGRWRVVPEQDYLPGLDI